MRAVSPTSSMPRSSFNRKMSMNSQAASDLALSATIRSLRLATIFARRPRSPRRPDTSSSLVSGRTGGWDTIGLSGSFDCVNDLDVARTAAQLSRNRFPDFFACRIRIGVEQRTGGDEHAWSAYAALRRAAFQKRLLQWVEAAVA